MQRASEQAVSVRHSFGLERKRPRLLYQAAAGTVALQSKTMLKE